MTNNDISIASTLLWCSPVGSELHSLNIHARERLMHNNSRVNKSLLLHGALSIVPISNQIYTCEMTLIAVCLNCRLLNHLLVPACYLIHPLIAQFIARCAIFREEIDESHLEFARASPHDANAWDNQSNKKTAWLANWVVLHSILKLEANIFNQCQWQPWIIRSWMLLWD